MSSRSILLLSTVLLFSQGAFYFFYGERVIKDIFGNTPEIIQTGGILLKFLGTNGFVLAIIFFLLKNEKTAVVKKLLLGGGILILLQLLNVLIFIPSVPTTILLATLLLFALFTYGYLKKN